MQLQIMCLCDILDESRHINPDFMRAARMISNVSAPEPDQIHSRVLAMAAAIWQSYHSGAQAHSARGIILRSLESLEDIQKTAIEVLASVAQNPTDYCIITRSRLCLPQAAYFRLIFGTFDLCHTIKKVMDATVRWNQQEELLDPVELQEASARVTNSNRVIASNAEKQANAMQKTIQGEHNISYLVSAIYYAEQETQDSIGLEFSNTIAQSHLEEIAEDMRASWIEALEGIVKAAKHLGGQ